MMRACVLAILAACGGARPPAPKPEAPVPTTERLAGFLPYEEMLAGKRPWLADRGAHGLAVAVDARVVHRCGADAVHEMNAYATTLVELLANSAGNAVECHETPTSADCEAYTKAETGPSYGIVYTKDGDDWRIASLWTTNRRMSPDDVARRIAAVQNAVREPCP